MQGILGKSEAERDFGRRLKTNLAAEGFEELGRDHTKNRRNH